MKARSLNYCRGTIYTNLQTKNFKENDPHLGNTIRNTEQLLLLAELIL